MHEDEGPIKHPYRQPDHQALAISGRRKLNRSAPSAASDFEAGSSPISDRDVADLIFTPYAVDAERAAILEVGMQRVPAKSPRAFFYLDQFEEAQACRLVPIHDYVRAGAAAGLPQRSRTFVFSIGRAGSTLVSRIFSAGGIASISEPDVLLNLSQPKVVERLTLSEEEWAGAYGAALSKLETAYGSDGPLAVKFRAQSSNQFHIRRIKKLCPDAHYVFLFRNPADWSLSFARKFGFKSPTMQWLFSENLKSCAYLKRTGAKVSVFDYDAIVKDPSGILRTVLPEVDEHIIAKDIETVMAVDSQHGLFDTSSGDGNVDADAFMIWWAQNRPVDLLNVVGLPY